MSKLNKSAGQNDDSTTTIDELKEIYRIFAEERNWDQWHSAKNLSMIAATEVAELMEIFRFSTDEESDAMFADPQKRQDIADEVVDSIGALLRLAQKYSIDIATEYERKFIKNRLKYPVETARSAGDLHLKLVISLEDKLLFIKDNNGNYSLPAITKTNTTLDEDYLDKLITRTFHGDTTDLTNPSYLFQVKVRELRSSVKTINKCYGVKLQTSSQLKDSVVKLDGYSWLAMDDIETSQLSRSDYLISLRLEQISWLTA